jgi:hypothetical protein
MELRNLPPKAEARDPTLRGLYPNERAAREDRRVLKVHIPTRLHLRLHALRITQGDPVSSTVEAALEDYFRKMAAARAPHEPAPPRQL